MPNGKHLTKDLTGTIASVFSTYVIKSTESQESTLVQFSSCANAVQEFCC